MHDEIKVAYWKRKMINSFFNYYIPMVCFMNK